MLFKNALSVFAVVVAASAQSVDDFTYNKFPAERAVCPARQGEPTTWTLAQLKDLALAASKGPVYDPSAGNVGGVGCAGMRGIPYYAIGDGRGIGFMGVAVDRSRMTMTLCTLQGGDSDGDGYNENCDIF